MGSAHAVDEVLGVRLPVVMVDQQRHPGVLVHDALEGRADPVVALVGRLAELGRRQDPAEGVEDDQRRVAPVDPGGDGVGDPTRLDPGLVLELPGDGVIDQQPPAAVLQTPVAVLQGEVQHRALGDLNAEGSAAGCGGQGDREHPPALADLGRADQQHRTLRDEAGDGVGQRREHLGVQPGAGAQGGQQPVGVGRVGHATLSSAKFAE
jgi:hypothetical protein